VASCVANAGFNADEVWMSVTYWPYSTTPEWQDKVMLLLALAYLTDGIGEERLVGVIVHVKLEERLAPVMRSIRD
jgi:hypothetical protein